MAELEFFQDLNGQGVAQLKGMRLQNVADQAAQDAYELVGNFGDPLGADNVGVGIYRVDLKRVAYWDGTQFVFQEVEVEGDIIFKGVVDASVSLDGQVEAIAGYQYVVGTAGTATATGITFLPSDVVEVGDQILFVSDTEAYIIQRNDEQATETTLGNVRLASQQEVLDGVDAEKVITPATLQGKLDAEFYVRQFADTVSIAALTPLTVTHNLNLVDRNSFTVNVMRGNSVISVDVDSVDENSITLTSLVPLTDVRVTVQGASAV